MTPYFKRDGVTLYHGDSREILPALRTAGERFGAMITDPVWPGASVPLAGSDRPVELFSEVAAHAPPSLTGSSFRLGATPTHACSLASRLTCRISARAGSVTTSLDTRADFSSRRMWPSSTVRLRLLDRRAASSLVRRQEATRAR